MALSMFVQMAALKKAGLEDTDEMRAFGAAIKANPSVFALSNSIADDESIDDETQKKFLTAMGKQWKNDETKTIFSRMEADLASNPDLATQYRAMVKSNPDQLLADLNNKYSKPATAQAAPAVKDTQPAPATPSPTAIVAGETQPSTPAPTATAPAQTADNRPPSTNNDNEILDAIANASDEDIKRTTTAESIHLMADKLAKMAKETHGINPATADAFATKIKTDPRLAKDIARNLQNNPELVRQLAKMAKDTETLKEPAKSMAQSEMNKLMANPQLLADAKYVQGLQQKMQMAENFKNEGLGGMFKSMFGSLGSSFSNMGSAFAGFSGPYQVFSMSRGGGLFPNVMINLDNWKRNEVFSYAMSTINPGQMTALAPDGKAFKDVPVKDQDGRPVMKDGKPVTEKVPNTIEVTTADGKKVNVIPAVGVLAAQQEKGSRDPSTGQYVAGNWRVPVVSGIGEAGESTAIKMVTMNPVEFAKYQARVNALSSQQGDGRQLAVVDYNETDARKAGIMPPIQVVDAKTGGVSAPNGAGGAVGQVGKPSVVASNDPDYALKANS